MAIKYSLKDLKVLASTIASFIKDSESNWMGLLEDLKKEHKSRPYRKLIKEIIFEMLGPYLFGFNKERFRSKGVEKLIFGTPVDMMPLYIESNNNLQKIVANWRLSIER